MYMQNSLSDLKEEGEYIVWGSIPSKKWVKKWDGWLEVAGEYSESKEVCCWSLQEIGI